MRRESIGVVYRRATLPPLELGYTKPQVHNEPKSIERARLKGISNGAEGSGSQWVTWIMRSGTTVQDNHIS
jgi:hypothetical protein